MRILIICLIVLSLLQCKESRAATVPYHYSLHYKTFDSNVRKGLFDLSILSPNKRVGFLRKLQYKVLQKRLKHLTYKADEGTPRKTNALSIISLVLGILGVIGIFAGISPLFILASLAAAITGIIALGKRYNNNKGSKAMAIIGLILGGGLFLLFTIFILSWGA
jgi:hypothetical protein